MAGFEPLFQYSWPDMRHGVRQHPECALVMTLMHALCACCVCVTKHRYLQLLASQQQPFSFAEEDAQAAAMKAAQRAAAHDPNRFQVCISVSLVSLFVVCVLTGLFATVV